MHLVCAKTVTINMADTKKPQNAHILTAKCMQEVYVKAVT